MSPHRDSLYVAAGPQMHAGPDGERPVPDEKTILEALAGQALGDRQASLGEVESAIQGMIQGDGQAEDMDGQAGDHRGASSAIRMLRDGGYVKDEKRWLTRRGFEAVGRTILREIMREMRPGDPGEHQTSLAGDGEILLDTTREFEPGDDLRHLNVQATLLNAVTRERTGRFPVRMEQEDMEQYETYASARTAIVYCIDLSSTMKTKMGDGRSRIRAAKKALWGLYTANTRYFARDSVHVIGFASMASRVDPRDIPFLRTFDANDGFLHYTNYQAAFKLAGRILDGEAAEDRRIVLITDGQPSACLVEDDRQRNAILADKPYSNFYAPEAGTVSRVAEEKGMRLDAVPGVQVYLCYRYKKVDPRINERTLQEAAKCRRRGISIDLVVVSDEEELVEYGQGLARELAGRAFHVRDDSMAGVLVTDYMMRSNRRIRW